MVKLTIAQIMHYSNAAKIIMTHVAKQVEATPVDQRGPLMDVVHAAENLQDLVGKLTQAEITVKG